MGIHFNHHDLYAIQITSLVPVYPKHPVLTHYHRDYIKEESCTSIHYVIITFDACTKALQPRARCCMDAVVGRQNRVFRGVT